MSDQSRHVLAITDDGQIRTRIVPPDGSLWHGNPKQDHIAYPAAGTRCRCGNC